MAPASALPSGSALRLGDGDRALREWEGAHAAALRSRTWVALAEVGDAGLSP
jgi:hypothetical protein